MSAFGLIAVAVVALGLVVPVFALGIEVAQEFGVGVSPILEIGGERPARSCMTTSLSPMTFAVVMASNAEDAEGVSSLQESSSSSRGSSMVGLKILKAW